MRYRYRHAWLLLCALPLAAQPQHTAGAKRYAAQCAGCHGADGRGGERGPDLYHRNREWTQEQLQEIIRNGRPAAGMPPFDLPAPAMTELIAFVVTLRPAIPGTIAPGPARAIRPVPFSEIAAPREGEWPTYHGSLSGNRHSALAEIHPGNVGRLAMRWMFTLPGAQRLEVTPVVVDGVMFVTSVNEVYALDARDGSVLWHFQRPRTKGLVGDAAGGINRGVAILGSSVYLATDDAHLLSLNALTGALQWETVIADHRRHYGATAAPLAIKDMVISGTSGGDEGVRGYLAAYDAATGKKRWHFWTVPAPGEPAAATWRGKDIEHGCASTWMTGTYDPKADLLYWTTGNPCPDYNGDERQGDNLYSDSVLALEPATGRLRWHFQFTPHDLHDWDAQQTPMLVDTVFGGSDRRLLVQANRNGFFYVLDRVTGKFLLAKPFVEKLTWASGIGPDGRPKVIPGTDPIPEGVRVCPAVEGATNWMSTSFDPALRLFFVMALEKCTIYSKNDEPWEPGKSFYGGGTRRVPGEVPRKVLRAIDPATGKTVWSLLQQGQAESWGGVLSTAGGLVFFGHDDGSLAAADAKTGRPLWHFPANQTWKASPMTFSLDGRQFVAIAGGPNVLVFGLPQR